MYRKLRKHVLTGHEIQLACGKKAENLEVLFAQKRLSIQ
jgi:hypothetical protein